MGSTQPTLEITAFPETNGGIKTVRIRKIKIEETPPAATFTLSPSSLSIPCGATTAQTFTVTNVNSTPNVTNHQWNLGANNGWLYNGSAAPQTISTGATNTLTLTPVCSAAHSNIACTVTAGGNNYSSNNCTVTATNPTVSLSGNQTFCTSTSTYTLANVPCSATVSWVSSDPSIATVPATGNPVTVTRVKNGRFRLTATASGSCLSAPVSAYMSIVAGTIDKTTPLKLTYNNYGYPYGYPFCRGTAFSFQLLSDDGTLASNGITNVQWKVAPLLGPAAVIQYNAGAYYYPSASYVNNSAVTIKFPTSPSTPLTTTYVQVSVQNTCGWTAGDEGDGIWVRPRFDTIQVSNQSCGGSLMFSVSPNPAASTVTIQQQKNKAQETADRLDAAISKVSIFDNTGILKKQSKYGAGTKQAQIDVSGIKAEIYFIEIISGKIKERQQLVIQR